jgi:hypothetical protein
MVLSAGVVLVLVVRSVLVRVLVLVLRTLLVRGGCSWCLVSNALVDRSVAAEAS